MDDVFTVAPGVIHKPGLTYDCYEGTKDALVAARVCKAHWFPASPVLFNRLGKIKRSFTIVDGETRAHLMDRKVLGLWFVNVQASPEECAKRKAKFEKESLERETESRRLAEADHSAKLASCLAALPRFIPGSMSNNESHFMSILRALSIDDRAFIVGMAERCLVKHGGITEPFRNLRLVVDNDNGARMPKAPAA